MEFPIEIHTSVSIKHGLRTTDCGLGIKYGLGIERGLRTMYIKTALEGKTERNRKRTSKNSSPSFNAVHVVYSSHGEGRLCRYSRQLKLNSEFYKKKEFEEISICSFTPIRSTELKKIVLVLVRSVKFLSDATIPFQIKPWEYED